MGYEQWVIFKIVNSSKKTVTIKDVSLHYGKFYRNNNKDSEIPISDIDNTKIKPNGEFTFSSCGRQSSPSGTEGEFDIYEDDDGEKLRHFYWDCPWGSSRNSWTISENNTQWIVDTQGANLDGGALGTIRVELYRKA